MSVLLANVEVDGRCADVRVDGELIVAVDPKVQPLAGEDVVDARGAALLPGLHDHHVHVLAAAAAAASVQCGPPSVRDLASLTAALRATPANGWVRGVGYVETVAGPLDRHMLDRIVANRPVRVQDRSGGLWVLNSLALQMTRLDHSNESDVERDASGETTGRLWRYDARLRDRIDEPEVPDLAALGRQLNRYGITGVTDATPDLDASATALLADAIRSGELPVDLVLLGTPDDAELPSGVHAGPRKLLLRDHDLPTLDDLVEMIELSHARNRPVAVHCVTRESLVLTVVALEAAGALDGVRIEHAAVVPADFGRRIAALGVAVVTQPTFIALRGDDYLREAAPDDVGCLYPYASLLAAGVRVAPSSDAPYGDLDPWRTLTAARDRTAASGATVVPQERVDAAVALHGLLSPLHDPGGDPRRVCTGVVADLCLFDAPLHDVLAEPHADRVQLVLHRGRVVFGR